MKYKVLTLTQPWATLIAIGAKHIETRSWPTKYRGPLLIHAAQGLGPVGGLSGLAALVDEEPFFRTFVQTGLALRSSDPEDIVDRLPRGAIVAVAELVECVPSVSIMAAFGAYGPTTPSGGHKLWTLSDQELAFGDYSPGRWGWLLDNVRALPKPIPARGQLGLWEWEGEVPV